MKLLLSPWMVCCRMHTQIGPILWFAILIGLTLLIPASPTLASQPAMELFKQGVRGFNLGQPGKSPLGPADFSALAATGANVVRLVLAPVWCEPCGAFRLDEKNRAYAQQVIAATQVADISVIIALSPLPPGPKATFWHDDQQKASIVDLWRELALEYKELPNVIAFDLINEPLPSALLERMQTAFGFRFLFSL